MKIKSKPTTDAYRTGWDKIFGKKIPKARTSLKGLTIYMPDVEPSPKLAKFLKEEEENNVPSDTGRTDKN